MSKVKLLIGVLYVIRIGFCLLPQHGYIQPDEFFQFTEPIAGDLLEIKHYRPWEFNESVALRSIFFPLVISGPCYYILNMLGIEKTPYLLLVCPRLMMTLLSFVCDWCIWRICREIKVKWMCLVVFSSSYISLCYLTRTFSNSIETVLLSIILLIVCKSVKRSKAKQPNTLAILIALGIFNRPTFPIFAFVPVIFWLTSGKVSIASVLKRSSSLVPSFVATCMVLCFVDTLYYRGLMIQNVIASLTVTGITNIFGNIVITPANFIQYNWKTSNLANHGLHPYYFHLLVNVPIAFSILGLIAILECVKSILRFYTEKKFDRIKTMFSTTFLFSLVCLSVFPHQEPRFLIPCLIPLCIQFGKHIYQKYYILVSWLLINLLCVAFYGFVHQAAVTKSIFAVHDISKSYNDNATVHFIFSRSYLPPQHLLSITVDSRIQVHDLSIEKFPDSVYNLLYDLKDTNDDIYLIAPGCLKQNVINLFQNVEMKYKIIKQINRIFPNFNFEELRCSIRTMTSEPWDAFSTIIWKITS